MIGVVCENPLGKLKRVLLVQFLVLILLGIGIGVKSFFDLDTAYLRDKIGYNLIESGHPTEALPYLWEAVELAPNEGDFHNNLGFALFLTGSLEESERECRLAVKLEPDHAWCLDSLGQVLTKRGKLTEAIPVLRHALEIAPGNERDYCLNSLGLALYLSGEKGEARADWQKATQEAVRRKEQTRAETYLKQYQ